MKPTILDSAASSWSEARARDSITRYRRSSVSQAVIVLDNSGGTSLWPELMHVLSGNFRLNIPELPPGSPRQAEALIEFLDTLGPSPVTIVASSAYSVPALDLALRGVKQVTRVVLIPDGECDDPTMTWFIGSAGPSSVPVLVVWRGTQPTEAVPTISRFVSGIISPS